VREAEGVLSREARALRADEPLAHEPLQDGADLRTRRGELEECAPPDLLADDGRAFEEGALVGSEAVEAGGEKQLDGGRDGRLAPVLLEGERDHLLGEERVALRRLGDPLALALLEILGQRRHERIDLLILKRLELEALARPAGTIVEELGTGKAEEQDGGLARPLDHVL